MRARNRHLEDGVSPILGFGDHDDDDEEGEPADEEILGENVEFGESEEAAEPRVITKPCRPSAAEVEAHNVTHIPFRNWCEVCVRGRAQDMGHVSKPKENLWGAKSSVGLWIYKGRSREKERTDNICREAYTCGQR